MPNIDQRFPEGALFRYGLAAMVVLVALLLRQAIVHWVGSSFPPYVLFYPAVALAGLLAGLGPGILATAIAALAADYWILPPQGLFAFVHLADALGLAIFLAMGVFMSVLAELYRRGRQKVAAYETATALRESEETIARERRNLQAMFDSVNVGLLLVDERGSVCRANDAVARWIGKDLSACHGLQPGDLIGCVQAAECAGCGHSAHCNSCSIRNTFEKTLRTGQPMHGVESEIVCSVQGTEVRLWLEVSADPLVLDGKRHVLLALNNITARKQAEEALRRETDLRQSVMNGAKNCHLVYLDRDFNFVRVNEAYARTCGYTPEEMVGKNHFALYPHAENEAIFARVRDTGELAEFHDKPFEFPDQPERGTTYWDWTLMPVKDPSGRVEGLVLSLVETTERKRAEQALRESEVNAEAANVAKSQFLASMSHELRTPMNAILGMTDLALAEELPPMVRDYLKTAKESADLLLELLNEILDFSRIEAGRFELESTPFCLRKTVEQVVKTLGVQAYEKGLELVCDVSDELPDILVGDPLRLRQVLMNLLSNAIKFTPRGEIVVTAVAEEKTADSVTVQFSVSDSGIGISPEHLEKIFAPFTQADASTTRRYGGTGLGLAISGKLVALMGGRISVESQLGEGSTFSFAVTLPVAVPQADPGERGLPDQAAFRDTPVLVVAENSTSRRILQQILTAWSMRPEVASDVPSALAKIHEAAGSGQAFRLVLADAAMPGIDGYTLAGWLQQDRRLAGSTVLMVSAGDRQNRPDRCGHLGATCLDKPISRSALFNAVARAMGSPSIEQPGGDEISAQPSTSPAQALRVLLAEDTAANQKLVCQLLGKRGHAVAVAANGQTAVDLLRRQDFDLLLMDVQMPVMDGFQATAEIRKLGEPRKARIPIVAMTAHALKGDSDRCLAAGMDAYLSKPIKAAELVELVERLGAGQPVPDQASPASETIPPSASSTIFQLEEALRRCDGEYSLFQEIVGYFFDESGPLVEQMRAALAGGRLAELADTAHRLRGTLVYLGSPSVAQSALDLEQVAKAEDRPAASAAFDQLMQHVDCLRQALVEHRA